MRNENFQPGCLLCWHSLSELPAPFKTLAIPKPKKYWKSLTEPNHYHKYKKVSFSVTRRHRVDCRWTWQAQHYAHRKAGWHVRSAYLWYWHKWPQICSVYKNVTDLWAHMRWWSHFWYTSELILILFRIFSPQLEDNNILKFIFNN